MEPQVCRFVDDVLFVLVFGCHHALDRLFADFLKNTVGRLGKKLGHVAFLGITPFTRLDHIGQRRQNFRNVMIRKLRADKLMIGHSIFSLLRVRI